ncbi:unnamed protein product [Diatraea saccharalis]|uniref:Trichohyalin-plectin-homology domain-containing protein n=1 Tax=Diatraea saccharalis TaxID=40085 RepID=A0A9N9R3S0_9NEOP|nr:unnamed protein product [Diatraea saccharalis]
MPIVLSKDEWDRIGRWADHGKEDPETVRRREYVRYLDAKSNAMTKSWPNSLENVNKRNEEARRARLEAAEAKNTNFYKRYVKNKQEEQERLMYSARETIFKNKDAPKFLLGAVIETVVQKERMEQMKFLEELRRKEAEQKRQDDDDIILRAKEWHARNQEKKAKRFEVNKQHQKEILEQAHEVSERNRTEYETELNMQKLDNIKAEEEMDAIKKFGEDFRSRQENEHRRREQEARDQLDDKLIDILVKSRARIEAKRKKTEKDVKDEKLRVLEQISSKLESGDAARDAKEQAILDKAIKEKQAM